jgi:hypothetical protein
MCMFHPVVLDTALILGLSSITSTWYSVRLTVCGEIDLPWIDSYYAVIIVRIHSQNVTIAADYNAALMKPYKIIHV